MIVISSFIEKVCYNSFETLLPNSTTDFLNGTLERDDGGKYCFYTKLIVLKYGLKDLIICNIW